MLERKIHTIYTLGYSGWQPQAIRATVDARRALLVDIRNSPRSLNPHWRQEALRGLWGDDWPDHYAHWRALGNLNYKNGGPIALADPAAILNAAAIILCAQPIVLMCGCQQHAMCHRLVAAEYLAAQLGAPIEHLYPARAAHGTH